MSSSSSIDAPAPPSSADPKDRFYESQGLRLHYADWGNEAAPPLLLIHGGRDHCRSWDAVARALQPHFHVIAPDLSFGAPGVGMSTENFDNARVIRILNDNFRSTFVGGQVVMTQGVNAMPIDTKARVLLAVQSFSNFTKDNDPHGEHDFGSIEIEGETYFFKVDYYALDLNGGSEDPADPSVTTRVLTIMRADEY